MSTTIEIRNLSKHYKSFGRGVTKEVDNAESTYLGEMTRHLVELTGGVRVRVNQTAGKPVQQGETIALAAEPGDIVVLAR